MERTTPQGLAQRWRLIPQMYRLEGEKCPNPDCGVVMFPPRHVCPECRERTVDSENHPRITIKLNQTRKEGTIYQTPNTPDPGPRDQVLG